MTPRFGHSVVAAAFCAQAIAVGLSVSVYPVFMDSIEREFGASRSATSWGLSLLIACGALLAPWVGQRVDRGSPRKIMLAGALLMTAGLCGIALAPSLLVAAPLWVGVVGAGSLMLGALPAMTVVANWFVARRGTMIAIAAMGTTLGGALMPPIANLLITELGWRAAIGCLGAAATLLGVPTVWLGIIKKPEEIGAHPDGALEPPEPEPPGNGGDSVREIVAEPRFWLVGSAFALIAGAGISFMTHTIPIATERGIAPDQAVLVLTISALFTSLGKLGFGQLTDRLGVRRAAQCAGSLFFAGWLGVTFASSAPGFLAAAALFTFSAGCLIPVSAGFVVALYGRERFGRATGVLGLLQMSGMLVLPPLVGMLFDASGGYDLPLRVVAATTLLPVFLFSAVRT